jgi:hypothetical protein
MNQVPRDDGPFDIVDEISHASTLRAADGLSGSCSIGIILNMRYIS